MDIDEDDEDVPQLVTLDQHLSDELGSRLKGGFSHVEERDVVVNKDSRKVPITILTGTLYKSLISLKCRISWGWEDDVVELHFE